ncbi:MAG: CDP-alcohol phosphatidyltransferase family protein [Aigarchaeota archaeon]|nr:CDP-alcohol phosphatidyltransferase family protein [Aigarchaeota archaeon]MDW8093255.1 CDP-alcohol phosphatidyltransferase family protein [Nitrososphaerota archaeon]
MKAVLKECLMSTKRSLERELLERAFGWLIKVLASRDVNPFYLTYGGLVLAVFASLLYTISRGDSLLVALGGVALMASGLFDAVDGAIARRTGRESPFGSFVDSLSDRAADVIVTVGIWYSGTVDTLLAILTLTASLLVSYIRAKAESLGVRMEGIGIVERGERIILLALGSLLYWVHGYVIQVVFLIILITSCVTIAQRCLFAYRSLSGRAR